MLSNKELPKILRAAKKIDQKLTITICCPGYDVKLCPAVPPLLAALGGLAAGRTSGCKKLARHPP